MDTLRVDYFEFDRDVTVFDKVNEWKKRKLWFFTVLKSEEDSEHFVIIDENNLTLNSNNGKPKLFPSEERALKAALDYNNDLVKIRQVAAKFTIKK